MASGNGAGMTVDGVVIVGDIGSGVVGTGSGVTSSVSPLALPLATAGPTGSGVGSIGDAGSNKPVDAPVFSTFLSVF